MRKRHSNFPVGKAPDGSTIFECYEVTEPINPIPFVAKIGVSALALLSIFDITRSTGQNTHSPSPLETAKRVIIIDYNPWEQLKDYVGPQDVAPPEDMTPNEDKAPLTDPSRELDPVHALYAASLFATLFRRMAHSLNSEE